MSRDYRGKKIVVYPNYIDSRKTRRMGRRISLQDSIPNPRIEEIVNAAEILGLNPIVEDSRYPREWWSYDKRVVIDKKNNKQSLLRIIAKTIKEIRSKNK